MPSLIEILIDYEPDMLEMIAEQWGIDQDLDPGKSQSKQIASLLAGEELMDDILQALPKESINALLRLTQNKGRLPFDRFTREFGDLREMGAARRGKIRPDRNPISPTEMLFYKGIIARAFFKQGKDAQEFVFIPDELLQFLKKDLGKKHAASVPVLPGYKAVQVKPVDDSILEHVCTFLAAKRADIPLNSLSFEKPEIPALFLGQLLTEIGLLDQKGQTIPQNIGTFLEAPRDKSFSKLVHSWQLSQIVNEIQLVPNLDFEGDVIHNPVSTRKKVLSTLKSLSDDNWISIKDFQSWVKTYQPDLLRSGGEYDSWIVRNTATGQYLKGFESWDNIEGALLITLIQGPLHWIGLIELAKKTKKGSINLFRPSKWMKDLLQEKDVQFEIQEKKSFVLNKDGLILIERSFPLSIRYQIARFCEWKTEKKERYAYQISHPALQQALKQGLQVNQLIKLIDKYGKQPLPPNIISALERWKHNELEAVIEQTVLLRVKSRNILDQLMASQAKSYIVARLNDTSAVVKSNSINQLKDTLLNLGILADTRLEV